MNSEFHCRIYKDVVLVLSLSQTNPIRVPILSSIRVTLMSLIYF